MSEICVNVICQGWQHQAPWMKGAKEFLTKIFNKIDVPVFFVENLSHNLPRAHASWYKLLLHKHHDYKYDSILSWDLDLLPVSVEAVENIIFSISKNINKFYVCKDTYLLKNKIEQFAELDVCKNFRWNCGLISIPKIAALMMEEIYLKNYTSTKPSWEQYHLADYFFDHMGIAACKRNNPQDFSLTA